MPGWRRRVVSNGEVGSTRLTSRLANSVFESLTSIATAGNQYPIAGYLEPVSGRQSLEWRHKYMGPTALGTWARMNDE